MFSRGKHPVDGFPILQQADRKQELAANRILTAEDSPKRRATIASLKVLDEPLAGLYVASHTVRTSVDDHAGTLKLKPPSRTAFSLAEDLQMELFRISGSISEIAEAIKENGSS